MTRYVALIRAINGSPHNRLTMRRLSEIVATAGVSNVSWYLQTGNLFVDAPDGIERDALAVSIEVALVEHGLRAADVCLWTPAELGDFVARDPFAGLDPESFSNSFAFSGGIAAILDRPWKVSTTTRWWNVVEAIASRAIRPTK